MLLIVGLLIAFVGILLILAPRVPFLGRLPGDIVIQRDGFSCFFPLATMVVLSILLSLLLSLISWLMRR